MLTIIWIRFIEEVSGCMLVVLVLRTYQDLRMTLLFSPSLPPTVENHHSNIKRVQRNHKASLPWMNATKEAGVDRMTQNTNTKKERNTFPPKKREKA
jgi:hypothetical protein